MIFYKTNKYIIFFLILFIKVNYGFSNNEISNIESSKTNLSNIINQVDSLFSSDGPIIVYENKIIKSYGVNPSDDGFKTYNRTVSKSDGLNCYVDETKQSFTFRLKDTIKTEKSVYDLPGRMFIISDIEGNFKGFQSILTGAGVIDTEFNWSFGKGHLVFVGDMFDRSLNVTECLWLLYKLEDEAEKKGGKVHFILGNHEVMNLKNDYRYVRSKYLINADSLKLEYGKWYDKNTELGRWLRNKNCIEKIGDIIFVHGGISKDFPLGEMTLGEINKKFRDRIDIELTKEEMRSDFFIGRESTVWYRGIAENKLEKNDLKSILEKTGAKKIIIGHTIFDEIQYLYDGKVIVIDLEHRINTENGFMKGLLFENNGFFVIDDKGIKKSL